MAWLTGYSAANKIEIEPTKNYEVALGTYIDPLTLQLFSVTDERTEGRYKYVGMTKAAAEACVVALYAAAGDNPGFNATAVWRGDGGYDVDVIIARSTVIMEALT